MDIPNIVKVERNRLAAIDPGAPSTDIPMLIEVIGIDDEGNRWKFYNNKPYRVGGFGNHPFNFQMLPPPLPDNPPPGAALPKGRED